MTLTLTLNPDKSYIVVQHSSTSIHILSFIKIGKKNCWRTDVRTDGRTDGRTFGPALLGHLSRDDLKTELQQQWGCWDWPQHQLSNQLHFYGCWSGSWRTNTTLLVSQRRHPSRWLSYWCHRANIKADKSSLGILKKQKASSSCSSLGIADLPWSLTVSSALGLSLIYTSLSGRKITLWGLELDWPVKRHSVCTYRGNRACFERETHQTKT